MLKKLRIKFVCINMTLVTIMLVIILSLIIHFTGQNLEQNCVRQLENIADNPVYLMNPTLSAPSGNLYFTLQTNQKGQLEQSYTGYYNISDHSVFNQLIHDASQISGKTGTLPEYRLRVFKVSTPTKEFYIFADISGEISTMEDLKKTCLFIGVLSFCAFLGISIYLANWAVKPVDQAWKQQRQFIADASHELKTPLTVILTNAELLRSPGYDPAAKSQFSQNIHTMALRMRHLVDGLLDLSHMDDHSLKFIMEKVNFSEIAEHTLLLFEPLYYETGLDCICEIEPFLFVKGSREHLKQVIDILLDNARKYAKDNSRIYVRLKKEKKTLLFSVETSGDPISQENLKRIFRRFYRVDQSRSSGESYGLGLSIAESIVKEHKGRIWAESERGQNTFFVRLGLI